MDTGMGTTLRLKIRHVKQEHEFGCMVACIAMVLNRPYDKIWPEFRNDFNKRGIDTSVAGNFICAQGWSMIEQRGQGFSTTQLHNQLLMRPFAPVHIVAVQQFVDDSKHCHAFVMNYRGKIYEPKSPEIKTVEFYEVRHIMGFWPDHEVD
jgi:hypothetical protein